MNNWEDTEDFAAKALDPANDITGIHGFYHENIFEAVYATNLLMRSCDVLVTKPSELAFYPVPKLFIRRIGGHEMWGAIHSAELGDGSQECESPEFACEVVKLIMNEPELLETMANNIITQKKIGTYDGAYRAVKLAAGEKLENLKGMQI